ncbi:MAG: hypothetical protein FWE05_13660 [Defluviitaleaceae bacterium]|nr:hypothetical protein [Defluviitaleaceae bacterium]
MSQDKKKEVINALCDFVIRASKEFATPADVEALPRVAELLIGIIPD